jgi:hypothetical protein
MPAVNSSRWSNAVTGEKVFRQDNHLTLRDFSPCETEQRRKEARIPCKRVVLMACREGEGLQFEEALLTNCSLGGIRILLDRTLSPGDDFLVKLKLPRMTLVVYSVRHCHADRSGYRIGAEVRNVVGMKAGGTPDFATILDTLLLADERASLALPR